MAIVYWPYEEYVRRLFILSKFKFVMSAEAQVNSIVLLFFKCYTNTLL